MKRLLYVVILSIFIGLVGCDFFSPTTTEDATTNVITTTEALDTTTSMQVDTTSTTFDPVTMTQNDVTTTTVVTTQATTTQTTTQTTTTQTTTTETTTTQTTTTQTTTTETTTLASFDSSELNGIFGYDIYALMPEIISNDYDVLDYSVTDFMEVYIDIFNWSENDANDYMDALDLILGYDNTEESWIIGDYYLYVYYDDETYPGEIVYGIGIYGEIGSSSPSTEIDSTELNNLFGFDIYALMPEILSDDYDVFDFSVEGYMEVYIDVFNWTLNDANDYMDALDLLLSYDSSEGAWVIDDYYLYIYEDDETYPGEIVYGVGIYGSIEEEVIYDTFAQALAEVEVLFNDATLSDLVPAFDALSNLTINQLSDLSVLISGDVSVNVETLISDWIILLEAEGFAVDSTIYNEETDVYSISITEDLTYAIAIANDGNHVMILLWAFDPELDPATLSTMPTMTSINEFEVSTFGQSGLPSTGTFDVLVIPVEIPGVPFPADYLTNLELVFNGSPEATGWQSVSSFYQTSSYGALNMNFDITTKFTVANNQAYYENKGSDGDQFAIYEALMGLDSSIDFSQYDSNQDGTIDAIYFIYSVDYNYDVDPWWAWVYSAQYGEASNIDTLDGLSFEYYTWISYAFIEDDITGSDGLTVNAETIIHETGHLLGAIDMYSYTEDYGPLGAMGMMDYNNGDHNPFHKILYGWSTPYLATQGIYDVTLESYSIDIDGVGSAVVIPYSSTDFEDGDAFDEFIIIFFYTPEGLYSEHLGLSYVLDHAGIFVYHVDARLLTNPSFFGNYFQYNNDGTSDFFAELLEVDGNDSLDGDFISMSDILTTGTFDLSGYTWHQGGSINITIEITSVITDTSDEVTFILTVE